MPTYDYETDEVYPASWREDREDADRRARHPECPRCGDESPAESFTKVGIMRFRLCPACMKEMVASGKVFECTECQELRFHPNAVPQDPEQYPNEFGGYNLSLEKVCKSCFIILMETHR